MQLVFGLRADGIVILGETLNIDRSRFFGCFTESDVFNDGDPPRAHPDQPRVDTEVVALFVAYDYRGRLGLAHFPDDGRGRQRQDGVGRNLTTYWLRCVIAPVELNALFFSRSLLPLDATVRSRTTPLSPRQPCSKSEHTCANVGPCDAGKGRESPGSRHFGPPRPAVHGPSKGPGSVASNNLTPPVGLPIGGCLGGSPITVADPTRT